jgi:hypothetical protein
MASATTLAERREMVVNGTELDILTCVHHGLVRLEGGELRCALMREPALLGVLADMEEQGLIACELRFRVSDHGRARIAELVAPGVRRAER